MTLQADNYPSDSLAILDERIMDELFLVSTFLERIHPFHGTGGEPMDGIVGMRMLGYNRHTFIRRFHPKTLEELCNTICVLRNGSPYLSMDCIELRGLDISHVRDTFEFLRFVYYANKSMSRLFCISDRLRDILEYTLEMCELDEFCEAGLG